MSINRHDVTYRWSKTTVVPMDDEIRNHKKQVLAEYEAQEDTKGNLRWMFIETVKVSIYKTWTTKQAVLNLSIAYKYPCGSIHHQSID